MHRFLFASILFLVVSAGASNAKNVFEDIWSVIVDPLKLDSSSTRVIDSMDRILLQLKALQEETDRDINEYLNRIEGIVESALSGQQELIEKAISDAAELEEKVYQDAVDLIWRAQCAAEVTLTDTVQRSLAEAINAILRTDPQFEVFGMRIVNAKIDPVQVVDPDIAYRAIKRQYLRRLDRMGDQTDAYFIVSTYSNIARLARITQCHYLGTNLQKKFIEDFFEYERRVIPWNTVVSVKL